MSIRHHASDHYAGLLPDLSALPVQLLGLSAACVHFFRDSEQISGLFF
jgi:hypothetical protein